MLVLWDPTYPTRRGFASITGCFHTWFSFDTAELGGSSGPDPFVRSTRSGPRRERTAEQVGGESRRGRFPGFVEARLADPVIPYRFGSVGLGVRLPGSGPVIPNLRRYDWRCREGISFLSRNWANCLQPLMCFEGQGPRCVSESNRQN